MKRVHRFAPEVPQRLADRGTELIEHHLSVAGVSRASELSEEARVRLARDLRAFFEAELPAELVRPLGPAARLRIWLRGLRRRR
jgi:hypothetical protein